MKLTPQQVHDAGAKVIGPKVANKANGASAVPHFRLTRFKDIRLGTSANYLVKDWIPRVGLTVVWGAPKCGKSFWVFDLTMHVALAREYRGHKVSQGTVVYCAFEGAEGFKARKEAFRLNCLLTGDADPPFYLVAARANLSVACKMLIDDIRAQIGSQTKPAVVVLDTLNRSLYGSENDPKDMALYLAAVSSIEEAFGCAIIVIHHCGIDGSRPRGHSSLTGAGDAEIEIKRSSDRGPFTASVRFSKDGPEGSSLACKLEAVTVGFDDDGDDITSCIVVPVEDAPATPKKGSRLSDREKMTRASLANLLCGSGVDCVDAPNGTKAVRLEDWREQCYRDGLAEGSKQDTRLKAFQRASEGLRVAEVVGIKNGWAWLAREAPL